MSVVDGVGGRSVVFLLISCMSCVRVGLSLSFQGFTVAQVPKMYSCLLLIRL